MIRHAKFGDIPQIVSLMREVFEKSIYREMTFGPEDTPVDIVDKDARSLVMNSIQRSGGATDGATLVVVAENDGKVTGFVIGVLQQLYHIGNCLQATDLYWVCGEGSKPGDSWRLYAQVVKWASKNPKVVEITPGVTGISEDYEVVGKMFERKGFRKYGAIYRKGLTE